MRARAFNGLARRLLAITAVYLVLALVGGVLSVVYDVAAEPGGEPADDLPVRGTAFAPPLFLPVALVLGAAAARSRGWLSVVGAVAVGLVGIAFFLGGTVNLPNDIDAARAAGSPTAVAVVWAVATAIFGLALAVWASTELLRRLRKRRDPMEVQHES